MKLRKGMSIFILVLVFTISGYSFGVEPSGVEPSGSSQKTIWLDDRYSALYPENVYLVGVGKVQIIREEYPGRRADATAKSDLSNKINALLNQTALDIFRARTPEEITDITEIGTKEIVKMLLGKVTIGARWIDKKDNSLYSLAVVKYSKIVQILDKQTDRVNSSAEKEYKLAEKYFKRIKIFYSLENYIQSLQLLDRFNLYNNTIQSLQERFYIDKKIKLKKAFVSTDKIEEKIEDIISSLKLEKVSGDTQEVSSGVLPQHITLKVSYNTKPVGDFPVNFSLPDGNAVYTPNLRSDEKGIVECGISNIIEGKKINRVIVTLDLPIDVEGRESSVTKWQKQLAKKKVEFIYFIFSPIELREWIDDVALSIAKQLEKYGKLSIVIEDFVMNDGSDNKLCKYFPDLLASQFSSIGREHLSVQRIQDIKKKRKMAILTGIFTEIGSGVTVSTRLDNHKGEYLAGSNITAKRTDEINNLLETTEPPVEETPPSPLYRPSGVEPSGSSEEKKSEPVDKKKYVFPEPEEEIKEKPVAAEIALPEEEQEEESIIKLKKKKEEPTKGKKRKKPKIKIID